MLLTKSWKVKAVKTAKEQKDCKTKLNSGSKSDSGLYNYANS